MILTVAHIYTGPLILWLRLGLMASKMAAMVEPTQAMSQMLRQRPRVMRRLEAEEGQSEDLGGAKSRETT